MKTTNYIFNFKALLVFIAMTFIISCSDDDTISYTETPGKVALALPFNNEECEVGEIIDDRATVTFNWESASNTEKYDLLITNLVTQVMHPNFNLTETTKDVLLERGYPYSWKITTKNSGEEVTISDTWKFYLSGEGESNTIPFPTTLLSPQSGVTVTPDNGNVRLEWNGSSDTDGDDITYSVFADTVDGNQEIPEEWKGLTETSITIPVNAGTIYYWHIETTDGVNTSISATYTFKTTD
ncbi:hypothetical protein MBM09_14110 [Flaviramulus sp. BrNp1-15]|uniref:hypothetical protein n=1 Tax=Flaviramulus sp. BrNp1-15 TaxID=2916754 RepID=UPI001EE80233|nr:hypothetical protein [Flaviramulus sp. BrNp1-15]ULC59035.1 hypothetical protein MBM09_14110 [Flaviramulus sp. BrNp1-15]